mgnify:CR=1 FL=1
MGDGGTFDVRGVKKRCQVKMLECITPMLMAMITFCAYRIDFFGTLYLAFMRTTARSAVSA